ncbi:hypothetical protein HGRIS_007114 [Hohenbuehelia grisea]
MKLHAPSLKVLVYEGWSKVQVPITEEAAEAVREERRIASIRAKGRVVKSAGKPSTRNRRVKASAAIKVEDSEDEVQVDADADADDEIVEVKQEDEEILDWCQYVNTFDVVVTTYNVLRADLNVARAAPNRPRREDVVYSNVTRPRSPLIMCEWRRVVMDEVQMVGGGKTEDMVSLIPRLSSFAVSGTPAKGRVSDLIHVLKFLRVDSAPGFERAWNTMFTHEMASEFARLFQRLAIRTMKANVRDELTIPQQTRYLVNIELGRVERHVYDQCLETALNDLGLDARGVAASEGWQLDGALLRTTLRRLRGLCTHPQVGQLLGVGEKLGKSGSLKTMAEVLQAMRDQNWRSLQDDCKAHVQAQVRRAQLLPKVSNNFNNHQEALKILNVAEVDARSLVQDVKDAIAALDSKRPGGGSEIATDDTQDADKGKGKGREVDSPQSDDSDSDLRGPEYEDYLVRRRALLLRLREASLTLHRVRFLQGDVYHNLGRSDEEIAAYGEAEFLRDSLLKTPQTEAQRSMAQLTQDANVKGITEEGLTIDVPYVHEIVQLKAIKAKVEKERKRTGKKEKKGEDASVVLVNEANSIVQHILNVQSALIWEWRTSIYNLLTKKLFSSGEEDPDGQEYQRTLDEQGEAETYLQVYTALLADRREALINERTLLAAHDAREKKLRHTKAAMKAAAAADADIDLETLEAIEIQPEHEVLHIELSTQRKALLKKLKSRALKSIVIELTTFMAKIKDNKDPEKILLQEIIVKIRQLMSDQAKLMDKLDNDLTSLRRVFNQRLLYFKQLQEIGDTVAEPEYDPPIKDAIQECIGEVNDLKAKINTNRARHRYLAHLAENAGGGDMDEDDKTCILCRCDFTRGFITPCAHVFCEPCLKAWVQRKEGKTCPVCRIPISPSDMQRFVVNDDVAVPEPSTSNPEAAIVPTSRRKIDYNMIDPKLFQNVQTMPSHGDFGSKIQTLVQHLLYLQVHDPGAKSICFSAWQDSLHILQTALKMNGISCLRIDQVRSRQNAAKVFRDDPDIHVLLLHGERENAGLNVTCASRVFLLESVVHHGFEVQAIARIDRMGQKRATGVYCYYAEDTVEKNILDLAARQGLSLYTKQNSVGTLNLASLAGDTKNKATTARTKTKKSQQKGDFIFALDDMLAILFPHMYEDPEYLIPEEEDVEMQDAIIRSQPEAAVAMPPRRSARHVNAVAGPSRLA